MEVRKLVKVYIDGNELSVAAIKNWESKRVGASVKLLERKTGKTLNITNADELAEFKDTIPQNIMLGMMQSQIRLTEASTNMVVKMSHGKRCFSVSEIDVDFCDAPTLREYYDDMMLNNTDRNRKSCLRANPDHYLLRGTGRNVQEVIESTGAMPILSHFFICYGDFDGLMSKQDADYPYQAAGVSYMENGIAIGAVRHQMKDTENGCHVKLTVEFPEKMPHKYIVQHQFHLACEFYNWFTDIEQRVLAEKAKSKK